MRIKKLLKVFLILASLLIASFLLQAKQVSGDTIGDLQNKINQLQSQIDQAKSQEKTLSGQISQFDNQISITTLKIAQTQEKIDLLTGRIGLLEDSLGSLTTAFSARAVETYKMARAEEPIMLLLTSNNLDIALSRFNYLKRIQADDRDLFERLQKAQIVYKDQKTDAQELQTQLQTQKQTLANQKAEKANLLKITKNNEQKYQELLASAKAELAVAQLGQGNEKYMRDVSEGETIGSIIPSASGCSTGAHLHFEIHQGDNYVDPNQYLKSSFPWSYYDGYDIGYYGSINPQGSWNWPFNGPVKITQGYGRHGYATVAYPYTGGIHTGIDMTSSDLVVKAVKPGKLYGGSYVCGKPNPGTLYYAKVVQDGGMISWYLHMVPQ